MNTLIFVKEKIDSDEMACYLSYALKNVRNDAFCVFMMLGRRVLFIEHDVVDVDNSRFTLLRESKVV